MSGISTTEIRIVMYTFLVLFIVTSFGVLRLFNAVVNLTRVGLKLREVISLLDKRVMASDKNHKNNMGILNNSLQVLLSSINEFKAQIIRFYDGVTNRSFNKEKQESDERE